MTSCLVSFSSWTRQRRLRLVLALQHPGDVADLGRHPVDGDDELAGAAGHVGVHVDHVGAVAERRVRRRRPRSTPLPTGRLSPVSAASATSSVAAAEHAPVGGHDVAGLDLDDVAGHELLGRQLRERAVAAHARLDDHHLRQRRDGRRGLALLVEPEHRVEQRQQQDHDPGAGLLDRVDRDHARGQQHDLHRVLVLAQERVPARLGLRLGELVRPVALRAARRPRRSSARARARRRSSCTASSRESTCQVGASVAVGRRSGAVVAISVLSQPVWTAVCDARRACRPRRAAAPGCRAIEPIAAKPPVRSANQHAARTFGPIEPAANSRALELLGRRAADRALVGRAPVRCRRRRRR